MKNLEENGEVFSYNPNQFKRTPFAAKTGDNIEWKRNGQRGSIKAKIIGWHTDKPDYVFIQNEWSNAAEKQRPVWIKKNSVLRVL